MTSCLKGLGRKRETIFKTRRQLLVSFQLKAQLGLRGMPYLNSLRLQSVDI